MNILQFNVRGIISPDKQKMKCNHIYQQSTSKKIDILLIQEWCVTVRRRVDDESVSTSDPQHTPKFPIELFPGIKVHYTSTECAVLHHEDFSVTPTLFEEQYHCHPHRNNFDVCGIILHTPKTDYSVHSAYRPQIADPSQLFTHPFHTDHVIVGVDFNIHHPVWGSSHSTSKSTLRKPPKPVTALST